MAKKRVFISGITGNMGKEAMDQLLEYSDQVELVSIVRDSEKNQELMKDYEGSHVDIVWGDLQDYDDIKKALQDVDYIIHIAALVSPAADYNPDLAWKINVGSVDNILKAVEELELWDVKLVYIGTVAQTGSRLPPIHWGRIGDPIKASDFDYYAASKTAAERKIIESGLKNWVSLRQTGILHYGLLDMREGIMYHQPLNNILEWVTERDSGRLIANLVIKDLPKSFWKRAYNIGGGESCRVDNYEFMSKLLAMAGVKDIKKIFDTNWFASKNFHGQYYLDSDELDDVLDFRRESFDDFLERLAKQVKFPTNLLGLIPSSITRKYIMEKIAKSEHGSLAWIKDNDEAKIQSFWGTLERRDEMLDWDKLNVNFDYSEVKILDHGYDETKESSQLDIFDMKKAAKFRGGNCLSNDMKQGDLDTHLKWECAFHHQFEASPRLVLKTGHWCPECEAPDWNYEEIAKKNPFFAQVWED